MQFTAYFDHSRDFYLTPFFAGYKIKVKYGHYESDNIELAGKVSVINTCCTLIEEAAKSKVNCPLFPACFLPASMAVLNLRG